MARPSNTNARRAQIVQGLLSAMAKQGYDGASIQMIAKEARLTPGLVHYHFKFKQEILVELVRHLTGVAQARLESLVETDATPLERLEALIDAYLAPGKGASPQAVAAWVLIGAEAISQKEVRSVYEKVISSRIDEIAALLEKVLESRGKPARGALKLAAGLISLIEGAFQLSSAAPGALPKGYAAEVAKGMVRGFI